MSEALPPPPPGNGGGAIGGGGPTDVTPSANSNTATPPEKKVSLLEALGNRDKALMPGRPEEGSGSIQAKPEPQVDTQPEPPAAQPPEFADSSTGDEFIDRKRAEIDRQVQVAMNTGVLPDNSGLPATPASSVPAPSVPPPADQSPIESQTPTLPPVAAMTAISGETGERSFLDIVNEGRGQQPPFRGPGGSEGPPRGPEGPHGPEWLTSPERGRVIVLEIIRLEAVDMSYTERYALRSGPLSETNPGIYNERHGTYLDQLYMDLKDYVRGLKEIRNNRDIKDPWNQQEIYTKMAENMARQADERIRSAHFEIGERPVLPEESVSELWQQYMNADADTDLPAVEEKLGKYFMEGRALGMIQIGEAALRGIYNQIQTGKISREQAQDALIEKIAKAKIMINNVFMSQRTKPYIAGNGVNLIGLAEAYAERTFHQFSQFLAGDTPSHKEGEMRFDEEGEDISEEDKETYWRPGHYPKMYEILAQTEQQFRTAANSFLTMVTNGSVGKSPEDLYQHFENFKDALGQVGSQRSQAGIIENEFMENLRVEMEAHGFMFGANYSNETYNPESFNKFMMAMALHEGPDRWVRLARSGDGAVGAFLWKFDHDPRITLFHNTSGSRGQLQSDTITQHYLQDQIRDILVEEGMGVVLKNYDPRDEKSIRGDADSIKVLNDREKVSEKDTVMEKARVKYFKNNQERIGRHQTEEDFKGLYEGFDTGNSHKVNYERYKDWSEAEKRKKLSVEIRRSVIIGKVQTLLETNRTQGRKREQLSEAISELIHEGKLTPRDKKIWEEAYDKASSAFDVAFQMIGASGEKVRRGGGIFYIHRCVDITPHIQVYERFKNTDDRLLSQEQRDLKRSGRIQIELRKPENKRELKPGDEAFMAELLERGRFVDHMPVYMAEQFVQTIENLCKIEYANHPAVVRADAVKVARAAAIEQIKQNGFEAKMVIPKLRFDTDENSPTFGDVIGRDRNLTQTIDFQTAVDSIYSRWTGHTYASYQQENRHMLTDPEIVKLAKKIRAGLVKPDEVDNLASWLLILDPTLKRVVRIEEVGGREEGSVVAGPDKSAMNMEVLLFDAAVEASNMGHWRINEELNEQFFSKNGDTTEMLTGYNLEDYGGISRFIIRMKQFIAPHAKRFARRYASELARTPMHISSMSDQWGLQGMIGVIEMFADPIGKMASQPEASQFAITKFAEQMRLGNLLYGALVGHVDSERGFSIEGLFEKPTNNSEKLHALTQKMALIESQDHAEVEIELLHGMLESFDRLWTVLKIIRTMESDTRNAQGALDLERDEVFIDGKLNPKLGTDRNTGSSRHSDEVFFNSFIDWLTSHEDGKGAQAYPGETWWYHMLKQPTMLDANKPPMTRAKWLFNKMAR